MIIQFICRAILLGVPLLYGSTGEIVTEKSGHLNLGIPGIMYVGAISGVVGSFLYENSCGKPHTRLYARYKGLHRGGYRWNRLHARRYDRWNSSRRYRGALLEL